MFIAARNMLRGIHLAWSITMASTALSTSPWVPATYLALFGAGAFIMRGAGCTINDLWDRRLDRAVGEGFINIPCCWIFKISVDRTKLRPLASGILTPPKAVGFLAGQLTAGLGILLQLNWYR